MTKEILQRVASKHKINLNHYDEVIGFINEKYTFIFITFAMRENCGGNRFHCGEKSIKMSVSAIRKREEDETDYTTQGWEWISELN